MAINGIGGNTKGPALLSIADVLFLSEVAYCAGSANARVRHQ